MQITFDTDNPADVARVLAMLDRTPNDVERLMACLREDKVAVLTKIAELCAGGNTPTVAAVASELGISERTLISHKMNIGRTVRRLKISAPTQTLYPNGQATYRMDERTRQAVLDYAA